jgi:FkbM family methyltransferase
MTVVAYMTFHFWFFVFCFSIVGACTMHLASLGLNGISVEPMKEHLEIINGSLALNPTFRVDLYDGGISSANGKLKATVFHDTKNWGGTVLTQVKSNDTQFDIELDVYSIDFLAKGKPLSIIKIDCEGCEYLALKG